MISHLLRSVRLSLWLMLFGVAVPDVKAQLLFRAEKSDGETAVGQLLSLTAEELILKDGSDNRITVPLSRLITLNQPPRKGWKIFPAVGQSWVFLATGDRLCVEPERIDDVELLAAWNRFDALPPLRFPLEACRGVVFTFPSDPLKQGLLVSSLTGRTEKSDLIVLRNGDHLQGEFSGLTDGIVKIETSLGEVQPEVRLVSQLVFNPELVFTETPRDPVTTVLLSDGSVLKLKTATADELMLRGTMLAGTRVSLPLEEIHELTVTGGDARLLAEMKPASQSILPYLDMKRPARANANALGGFLSMQGRPRLSGIGVVGGTVLDWQLDGSFHTFQATCGLDDAARGRGSVIFEVQLDGRSVWRSGEITGTSRPVRVPPVRLSGAKKLSLQVEFARQGNVLDYADWADAILIRDSSGRKPGPVDTGRN